MCYNDRMEKLLAVYESAAVADGAKKMETFGKDAFYTGVGSALAGRRFDVIIVMPNVHVKTEREEKWIEFLKLKLTPEGKILDYGIR